MNCSILQDRLDIGLQELESILTEVRDALSNIKRLKIQNQQVTKETAVMKKTVERLRDSGYFFPQNYSITTNYTLNL